MCHSLLVANSHTMARANPNNSRLQSGWAHRNKDCEDASEVPHSLFRALLMSAVVVTGVLPCLAAEIPDTLPPARAWLAQEAERVIRASLRTMDYGTAAFPPQAGSGYEAFWLRDYGYTLEGAVDVYSDQELSEVCRLFVRSLRAYGAASSAYLCNTGAKRCGQRRSGEYSPTVSCRSSQAQVLE